MSFDTNAWQRFNGGLVLIGLVLILAGIGLALARTPRLQAAEIDMATRRTASLRRILGVTIAGLGIVFSLWGLAVVPF